MHAAHVAHHYAGHACPSLEIRVEGPTIVVFAVDGSLDLTGSSKCCYMAVVSALMMILGATRLAASRKRSCCAAGASGRTTFRRAATHTCHQSYGPLTVHCRRTALRAPEFLLDSPTKCCKKPPPTTRGDTTATTTRPATPCRASHAAQQLSRASHPALLLVSAALPQEICYRQRSLPRHAAAAGCSRAASPNAAG